MIQKLLVPVDFTEASKKAINYAIVVAERCHSKIIFVHGFTESYAPNAAPSASTLASPPPENIVSHRELGKKRLTDFLDAFPKLRQIDFSEIIGMGSAVDVICQTAEDENTGLIIMGTQGADSAKAFFIGTNSEKVSRKSNCPVLVIPEDLKSITMDSVCLAVDTDPLENIASLDVLVQISTAFNAKLRVIHISDKEKTKFKKEEVLAPYRTTLEKIEHSFHVFYDKDPITGISDFLTKNPVDVLSLFYREHGFFERVLQPGLRKKMVFETDIPLLILK